MRNRVVLAVAAAAGLALLPAIPPSSKKPAESREFLKQIPDNQKILQALNRLTFGPRPGDAQAVKAMGLKKWIDQQLHPASISENATLLEKLKTMDTLTMSASEIVRNYPQPQMIRRMVNGQMPFPADPDRKLMLTRAMERYEKQQAAGVNPDAQPGAANNARLAELLSPDQMRSMR